MIHRDRDGADRPRGRARKQVLDRVRRVDDDVLARAKAAARERVGKTVPKLVILPPRQAAVVFDQCERVGAGSGMGGDGIHLARIVQ